MAEREAIYKLKFQVDKSGQQESVRAIDALGKEFTELDADAQQVSKSAQNALAKLSAFGQGRAELQRTADEAKQLAVGVDDVATSLERAADASADMKRVANEARNAREELSNAANAADNLGGRLDQADERFDVVSRRVGLAGDVQSNLGSIRGLSQTAGLGGAGEAIGVAGEFAALTEELPRLKAALSSMPDVLKFVASSIGTSGVGLIGALAALAVVTALAAKQTREQAAVQAARFAGEKEIADLLRNATTEEAIAKQKELADAVEEQQARLDELRSKYEAGTEAVKDAIPVLGALAVAASENDLPGAQGQIQEYYDEIGRSEGELEKAQTAYADLTAAIGAGATAANDATKALNDARNAAGGQFVDEFERTQKEHQLALSATSEEVGKMLADNIVTMGNLVTLLDQLGSIADPTEDITKQIKFFEDQLAGLIADNQGLEFNVLPFVEAREAETAATEATTSAISNLNSALGRQEEVTKERIATLIEQAQSELEFSRFLKTATAENVAARIEALQEEAAMWESLLPELQNSPEELQKVTDKLEDINAELTQLGSEGVIAAIQREQAELTAEIIKIESARDEKIIQLRAQAAAKEAELYQDLQQDLADAVADANESRADALRDYEKESRKIAEDLARKRLDIEKKYSRDAANAVGDRDALALYQAKQTRDDGLEDAEEAAAQQRADTQRNYAEQLDTINRELAKQQQTLQAKYAQQLADLRTATANSINMERQKAAQEIQARQQAYQQELAQLNSFAQSGVASVASFATNSLTTLGTFVERAREIMAGLVASAPTAPTTPIPTPAPIPIPPIVRPPGAPGGPQQPVAGINISVAGYTAAQIQAELNKVLKVMIPN